MAQINYEISKLNVVRETEKAYGLKAWVGYFNSNKCWEVIVWVPKSVVKDGVIADWFLSKKFKEYADDDKDLTIESK